MMLIQLMEETLVEQVKVIEGVGSEFELQFDTASADGWHPVSEVHIRTVGDVAVCTVVMGIHQNSIDGTVNDPLARIMAILAGTQSEDQQHDVSFDDMMNRIMKDI